MSEIEAKAFDSLWMHANPLYYTPEEIEAAKSQFIEECRFAQQVNTADGIALLIGGDVVLIKSASSRFHADAICRALRRANHESGAITSGDSENSIQ